MASNIIDLEASCEYCLADDNDDGLGSLFVEEERDFGKVQITFRMFCDTCQRESSFVFTQEFAGMNRSKIYDLLYHNMEKPCKEQSLPNTYGDW